MKLQDAFVAEAGAIGDFQRIGYAMPSSSNFVYTQPTAQGDATKGTTNIDALGTSAAAYWDADNNTKLNDCPMHSHWQVQIAKPADNSAASKAGAVVYTATNATASCLDLTPNFSKIGG